MLKKKRNSLLSTVLRTLQISKKLTFANEIVKYDFSGMCCVFSKTSNDAPKKPLNPYFRFFCSILPELKSKYPDTSYRDKIEVIKNLWKSLDLDKRRQYFDAYYEEMDRFKFTQLQNKCEQQNNPKIEKGSSLVTKEERNKLKKSRKMSGIPKKNLSSFSLFLVTKKNILPREPVGNWIRDIVKEYQNLSEDEKIRFKVEAKKLKDEYKKKVTEWESSLIEKNRTDLLFKRSKFIKKH